MLVSGGEQSDDDLRVRSLAFTIGVLRNVAKQIADERHGKLGRGQVEQAFFGFASFAFQLAAFALLLFAAFPMLAAAASEYFFGLLNTPLCRQPRVFQTALLLD